MRRSRDLGRSWLLRNRTAIPMALGLFVAGILVGSGVQGEVAAPVAPDLRTLLTTSETVVGEPIVYETSQPALITARELILLPGQALPWHRHPMPTFGYVIEGEIEVDYGAKGRRTFQAGQALMEAQAHAHTGRNRSNRPVRVLAVSIGSLGQPLSVAAPASLED